MSFKDLGNALSAAWSGNTVRRLDGIEKRLKDLDGRKPGHEDDKLEGIVGELLKSSKADNAEPKIVWRPSFFNGTVALFILMLFIGGFVFNKTTEPGSFLEYAAYAMPLLAGFVAGIGFYNKKYEVPAFIISVLVLVGALFLFLRWKGQLLNVGNDLLGLVGIPLSLCLIWVVNRPPRDGKKRYRWEKTTAVVVFIFSVLMAATWTTILSKSDPEWVQVTWRYFLHQFLKNDNATNPAASNDIMTIQTPSGAVHFCSVDDFRNMNYLRSRCTQSHVFRGLLSPSSDQPDSR